MPRTIPQPFTLCSLSQVTIEDEASFRHVGLYADLKDVLRRANYRFRILPAQLAGRWDRALLLNLTYWGAEAGGDVLVDRSIPADVVAHAAWHHLAQQALQDGGPPCPAALFLGESIASAFDVYLIGRLLAQTPDSSFLQTQIPAMSDAAAEAGVDEADFDALLQYIGQHPERAFAELRELLFDAPLALLHSPSMEDALSALSAFDSHRFAPILHHYELSNWVLYARAYARSIASTTSRAMDLDRALRAAPDALQLLTDAWVLPALGKAAAHAWSQPGAAMKG